MLGHLTPEETKAVLEYKKRLAEKLGPELVKVSLYGSKARGDFNNDSDIDLLVIVEEKTSLIKEIIYDTLLDINALYDIYNISVHIYTDADFNGLASHPLSIPFWENYHQEEVQI